jgi:hypothetical protein
MVHSIEINKQIPSERWVEFFDMFSNGNRGRLIAVEIVDLDLGDQTLISNAPLMAMVYDPVGKGNDLVIETGRDTVSYGHTIDAPTEVWTGQDSSGVVQALKILDAQGRQTLVRLEAAS